MISTSLRKPLHLLRSITALIYYRFPARKLKVIGVTGTDGKTTTTTMIYSILKSAGKKVSMISTVDAIIGSKKFGTGLHTTTPNPFLMQKLLRKMVDEGDEYAVLEVSSHGIDQYRVLGINFDIAVLTNITREHLDYHHSFEEYLATKAGLLKSAKIAILNKKDESFQTVKNILGPQHSTITYPIPHLSQKLKARLTKFPEPYNQLNAEAAILTAQTLGITESNIIRGLNSFRGVEGRMNRIKNNLGLNIIVDFAHTPNALSSVLSILRKQTKNKLICVVGSAGERDRTKRPIMGKITSTLANVTIFTAEDPRNEDVNTIIDSMERDVPKSKNVYKIPERGEAIRFAINDIAQKGDTVVICGKGHEKSMAYGKIEYPWSDVTAVKKALRNQALPLKHPR